jgi:CubicO group peptidase (beta-lactamase class C family)
MLVNFGHTDMRRINCALILLVLLTCQFSLVQQPAFAQVKSVPVGPGPHIRADGPDAQAYGMDEGYPRCKGLEYVSDTHCRVGAFSNFDKLFPSRKIAASTHPSTLKRAPCEPEIRYSFAGKARTLEDYLNRRPITGFLIAKDDTILIERYQYGRSDTDHLTSFSMAKTIVGLSIGIALQEGKIRSIDDLAQTYVPGLQGTAYGQTPIKALLQMRSGVFFREDYADSKSDIYTLAHLTLGQDPGGSLAALKRFNFRRAAPGTYFSYSSADTLVLALVLTAATGRTLSDYVSEKLWRPLGTEADATWAIDATGQEIAFAYVNAVLRDWARLGLMLAHDGSWSGRSIVPKDWLLASLANPSETGSALSKYGYQMWLSEDLKRYFLQGLRGQFVIADPVSKLVLVQTSLSSDNFLSLELSELWTAARAQFGGPGINTLCGVGSNSK